MKPIQQKYRFYFRLIRFITNQLTYRSVSGRPANQNQMRNRSAKSLFWFFKQFFHQLGVVQKRLGISTWSWTELHGDARQWHRKTVHSLFRNPVATMKCNHKRNRVFRLILNQNFRNKQTPQREILTFSGRIYFCQTGVIPKVLHHRRRVLRRLCFDWNRKIQTYQE